MGDCNDCVKIQEMSGDEAAICGSCVRALDGHVTTYYDAGQAARARVEVLEAALQSAIRSHENLVELNIIPDRFKDEARRITDRFRAALAAGADAPGTGQR